MRLLRCILARVFGDESVYPAAAAEAVRRAIEDTIS